LCCCSSFCFFVFFLKKKEKKMAYRRIAAVTGANKGIGLAIGTAQGRFKDAQDLFG
jgi:hypothetical protein